MGVDLRLLPFDADHVDLAFSHTILNLGRDYDLHDEIRKLRSMPVPNDFSSFCAVGGDGESTYGKTLETPYGEKLEWVLAGELCAIKAHESHKAIWAYLKCLPPETKVALYWH